MIGPGIKFRAGNRWLTPQPHELLFRAGGVPVPDQVVLDTVRTQVGTPLAGDVTLAAFVMPADVENAALIVCISATDLAGGATVNTVTWNGHSLTNLIETVHPTNNSTATFFRWNVESGDLGDTSDIVVDFDAASVSSSLVCAYVVEGVDDAAPEASDDAWVTDGAIVSVSLTAITDGALVLSWVSHVYTATPAPVLVPTGPNQAEITDSQVNDGAGLLGVGSAILVEDAGAGTADSDWGDLDASSSSGVEVAIALKPYVLLTQPVTAKLVMGWDFSGIDSTVTVTGAGISSVTDSSGNGNTGVQATDARRPLYVDTINGHLVADSNSTTRFLTIPADIAGWTSDAQPPLHILVVVSVQTWTNSQIILGFATAGLSPRTMMRLSTSGGNRINATFPTSAPSSVSVLSTETTLTTGTTYLVEMSQTGGTGSIIINEGTAATVGGSSASADSLSTRRLFDLTSPADAWVGAVYLFNDALTGGELTSWRAFLKQRWGYV